MDVLRAFSVLGVLLIHISAGMLNEKPLLYGMVVNQWSRFAVPAFLFLSGLGLTLSKRPYQGYIHFIWYRLSKILPLYLLWTIAYLLIPVLFNAASISPGQIVIASLTGTGYYHLYFIPLIIQLYLIYPFISKYLRQTKGLVICFAMTLAVQLTNNYLSSPDWMHLSDARNVLNWLFYFALGVWVADRKFKPKISKGGVITSLTLIISSIIIVVESYANLAQGKTLGASVSGMRPSIILYSLTFGLWVWSKNWATNIFRGLFGLLSNLSYEIYLVHALVLSVYNYVFRGLGYNLDTLLYAVSSFAIVLTLSIV